MWSFSRDAVAAVGIIGCIGLVVGMQDSVRTQTPEDGMYETTGSITPQTRLPLSDLQRERIHQALLPFPDSARADPSAPEPPNRVANDASLQDLPGKLTQDIPLLRGHKFLKLHDRILLVEPANRTVVAMIPRYRLLP